MHLAAIERCLGNGLDGRGHFHSYLILMIIIAYQGLIYGQIWLIKGMLKGKSAFSDVPSCWSTCIALIFDGKYAELLAQKKKS
ncbi:hypothetical protein ACJX0J_022501, partial [Zea mays]